MKEKLGIGTEGFPRPNRRITPQEVLGVIEKVRTGKRSTTFPSDKPGVPDSLRYTRPR